MALPPEDEDFRQALQGVEPLPRSRRAVLPRARPAPFPRQTRLDERAALAESLTGPLSLDDAIESGEELAFLRDGLSRDVLRKLRRGHWVVEDHLDLHGMNRLEAAVSVSDFLRRCMARRLRCVRIVHGKGLRSSHQGPVLKTRVDHWLRRTKQVLAFVSAQPRHGGTGALYVLLRAGSRGD